MLASLIASIPSPPGKSVGIGPFQLRAYGGVDRRLRGRGTGGAPGAGRRPGAERRQRYAADA